MRSATRRALGIGCALLLILAGLAWWQWFPRPREPGYHRVATWGEGEGPGKLQAPIGVALAGDAVFVSDAEAHRIVVFDRQGQFSRAFGHQGKEPGQLLRPMHIAAQGDRLYVAEYGNDRIQVFDPDGESLATLGTSGSGPAQFDAPGGVAVDDSGRVYVADFFNHRVQVLTADGTFSRQLGTTGKKGIRPGSFNYPTDVALLAGGDLIVADAYNDRIQRFDREGEPLGRWGGPFALNIAGAFHGWFRVATGVGVASDGAIFVADFYNHRVQKFRSDGTFLTAFGGPDELDRPTDVAVADDGTVYVVDFGNHRIQVYAAGDERVRR